MEVRSLESTSARSTEMGQELVDAVVAAVDANRSDEVEQVRRAFEPLGLDEAFSSELRLSGFGSECIGDCWGTEFCLEVA